MNIKKIFRVNKAILLWIVANLFFAFQFILRLSVGILREEIMTKFAINAANFGSLAGYYYLGYATMQIPIGIMLDKFSFRNIMIVFITITSVGSFIFAETNNWNMLLFSRFLIGSGSAVAFLAVAKIIKTFFKTKYHSLMIGLSFSFGLIGAVFGETPMQIIFNHYGYIKILKYLAYICFTIGILIFITSKLLDKKAIKDNTDKKLKGIKIFDLYAVIINPKIILISLSGGLMVGSLEGFADIWAIPFFRDVYSLSLKKSIFITSQIYIGMCFGGPILAILARWVKSNNVAIAITGISTIMIFMILFNTVAINFIFGTIIMFILGILCCYQVLVFTLASNYVLKSQTGFAVSIINCVNMLFGYFFHSLIGTSISKKWDGILLNGLEFYSREVLISSLSIIPIGCFIGLLCFLLLECIDLYKKKAFKNIIN